MAMNINNCSVNITINNYAHSKQCNKCLETKPLTDFHKDNRGKFGCRGSCKSCRNLSEAKKAYNRKNKEQRKEYNKRYREDNREKLNEYKRNKYNSDEHYKLRANLKSRINYVLQNNRMSAKTQELVGCNLNFLRKWLESQFSQEMTWQNYGECWECEHVRPCSSFDLTDPAQQRECFSWCNTQPLSPEENLKKESKRDLELEAAHALKAQMFLNK